MKPLQAREKYQIPRIAIIGSGPAGLMAASVLARTKKFEVHLFEKRPAPGRKLLIAGSSGLNISHELELKDWLQHYDGGEAEVWKKIFLSFGQKAWLDFIENTLGMETFLGTSKRYFVQEMKASGLLKKWTGFLQSLGVWIHLDHELENFKTQADQVYLSFRDRSEIGPFNKAAFFLGGASWEDAPPSWISLFEKKSIQMKPFQASNVGFEVAWSKAFLKEAEGKPLKKINFQSPRGSKLGELMVTEYGLEGTPIYFYGQVGEVFLDLKPDLELSQIFKKLSEVRENYSPIRRVKQKLDLCDASLSLLFHHTTPEIKNNLEAIIQQIKHFPLTLLKPRPLAEAISSRGGVCFSELSESFELKKFPGIYTGGEMLDWDAPTGGFLIQACVSQGAWIANSIIQR